MRLSTTVSAALAYLILGSGCMYGPENGDWIPSIFHDIPFTITSLTDGGGYRIDTAELDNNGNVLAWHFLAAGTTDTFMMTDIDGRDIYYDQKSTAVLIGWKDTGGPGCGSTLCNSKVRIRTLVESPSGPYVPAYTFDDGSLGCEVDAMLAGGADKVITDCARSDSWVEVFAYGN